VNLELDNDIDAANLKAQYDMYAKQLLSHKMILAHILVNTIDEFKGMKPKEVVNYIEGDVYVGKVPIDGGLTNIEAQSDGKVESIESSTEAESFATITKDNDLAGLNAKAESFASNTKTSKTNGNKIVGLNTENAEINEGTIFFDLIFYVRMKDGLAQMIVNIEVQKDLPTTYKILNRAVFYTSRLISSQKQREFKGQDFDDIKQVYSIWIVLGMEEDSISHLHMVQEDLVGKTNLTGNLDLFNIVFIGLTNKIPEKEEKKEFHRLLSTLLSDKMETKKKKEILNSEYDVNLEENSREEMTKMCNLGQAVYDNGVRDGVVIGEARGFEAYVRGLKKHHFTAQEIYDDAIENELFTKVTLEDVTTLYNQN
jgi:hypothetical protein